MATVNIPDTTSVGELQKALAAVGKHLQYASRPGQSPKQEDIPHGHNRRAAHLQLVPGLADQTRNH